MRKMTILYILFILTSCSGSDPATTKDKLSEELKYPIEDNRRSAKYDSTALCTGWYYLAETDNGFKRQLDKSAETYFIDPKPILTVKNFRYFQISEGTIRGKKHAELDIELDNVGAESWSVATKKTIGKKLAFIVNDRLLYVPKITAQINSGGTMLNRDVYSRTELEKFKEIIESERQRN